MAYTANHDTFTAPRSGSLFARIGAFLERSAARNSRAAQVAHFEAMSDAQLAKLGVTREGIVHHVFRDKLYI